MRLKMELVIDGDPIYMDPEEFSYTMRVGLARRYPMLTFTLTGIEEVHDEVVPETSPMAEAASVDNRVTPLPETPAHDAAAPASHPAAGSIERGSS